jgi:hypothetical protein
MLGSVASGANPNMYLILCSEYCADRGVFRAKTAPVERFANLQNYAVICELFRA